MDRSPIRMENIPMQRGDAFYFGPRERRGQRRARVTSLGIRELMPAGLIRHGGWGVGNYLFMDFHTPAIVVDREGQPRSVEHAFILWRPGATYQYGAPDTTWVHSWMNASGTDIDEAVARSGVDVDEVLPFDLTPITLKYLHALYDELQDQRNPDEEIVGTLIRLWIREIARATGNPANRPQSRLIEARHHIEAHYSEPLRLGALARKAALSVSQFSALFKTQFGLAPIQYLRRLRLRRAAQLLDDPNLSISDVAFRVGYEDALNFSRQFRRFMGKSPTEYRANAIRRR